MLAGRWAAPRNVTLGRCRSFRMHSGHMGIDDLADFFATSVWERTAKKIINGEPFKIEVLAG